jgi:hypothetical protein
LIPKAKQPTTLRIAYLSSLAVNDPQHATDKKMPVTPEMISSV